MPIILLSSAESDDYAFVQHPTVETDDYGAITDGGISYSADWGQISSGIGGALQLGPLKRQVDRQKFNKEGGFSKEIGVHLGGGYTIEHFKDTQISVYVNTPNEKTRIVMNSHITVV